MVGERCHQMHSCRITSRYLPDGPVKPGSFGGHASKAELARRRRLAAEEA
jgi:hypothetical protein